MNQSHVFYPAGRGFPSQAEVAPLLLRPERTENVVIKSVVISFAVGLVYFVLQAFTGTNLIANILLSGAIIAGICAVIVGGGIRSMIGLLNFSLLLKILLISIAIKILLRQPSESYLAAPEMTPRVMCLGFLGVLAGTAAVRLMLRRHVPLCAPVTDPDQLTNLFWVCFVVGNIAGIIGYFSNLGSVTVEGVSAGGLLGISHFLQPLRDFCVAVAVARAHFSGSRRILLNPLVLLSVGVATAISFGAGSKILLVSPLFYGILAVFAIQGLRHWPIYLLVAGFCLILGKIVFPIINYSRTDDFARAENAIGASVDSKWASSLEVTKRYFTDSNFRAAATIAANESYTENQYFGNKEFGVWFRFALLGNADNLIAPTTLHGSYTGWETIIWGVRMLPPRFLYKNKPFADASLELAQISGLVDPEAAGAPLAFGFMACMYNAFGLFFGAFIGCGILSFVFYYCCIWIYGNASNANIWLLYIVGYWHHLWAEINISTVIATIWQVLIGWIILVASKRVGELLRS